MGIGLLSLLVLFPLGALQMAQAIRDDRCTHAAMNARALANMVIPFPTSSTNNNNLGFTIKDDPTNVFPFYAGQNPNNTGFTFSGLPLPLPAGAPSSPVYIDPIGVKITTGATNPGTPLGQLGTGIFLPGSKLQLGIPRVFPSNMVLTNSADIERWCMMTDDIQFQENGTPLLLAGTLVQRENRYSWAWLCRQNLANSGTPPTPQGIQTTVVVYDRRPLTPLGGETVWAAQFNNGSNLAYFRWTGAGPNLRPGTWILDATLKTQPGRPVSPPVAPPLSGGGNFGMPNGYFYRVVSVGTPATDSKGITTMTVELHMPARASSGGPYIAGANPPQFGVAVVMENVAEVYEKGPNIPQ